jgi:hypothetical protein
MSATTKLSETVATHLSSNSVGNTQHLMFHSIRVGALFRQLFILCVISSIALSSIVVSGCQTQPLIVIEDTTDSVDELVDSVVTVEPVLEDDVIVEFGELA